MATAKTTRITFKCDRPGCQVQESYNTIVEVWGVLVTTYKSLLWGGVGSANWPDSADNPVKKQHLCPECNRDFKRWWNAKATK
jgi:hypothetical protein